jgi:tetratricopeptide (TPR) repeat protein
MKPSPFKITTTHLRTPPRGTPKVVAVFCYRYDASLVPDLIANISPFVHAIAALDDRASPDLMTPEPPRRAALHAAARAAGADWIFAADPDERYEPALERLMPVLTRPRARPVLWRFRTREMFTLTDYRSDGVWGGKHKVILYPAATTHHTAAEAQHGAWVRRDPSWVYLDSGLNLYHLRHLSDRRTQHRRDTWAAADPLRVWQVIGWDYLADSRAARFDTVPPDRRFRPDTPPDDGLWALHDTGALGPIQPDPIDCRLNRIAAFRNRAGSAHAAHVAADLAADDPADTDLALVTAALHLRAGDPAATRAVLPPLTKDSPFLVSLLHGRALLAQGDQSGALSAANAAPTALHDALRADVTRDTADFTAPDAPWRTHARGPAAIAEGAQNGTGPLCVIVISHAGAPSPQAAVASLAAQSDDTELVLVRSGSAALPDLGPLNDRVRRIATAAPLYVGATRNIGILASRGAHVAFLAGDCRVEPGWTAGRLARHAAGALSVSTPVLPERPGTLIGDLTAAYVFPRRDPWLNADLASHYGRSYDRSLFAAVGLFVPGLRVIEDTEFNARVDALAPPVWAPEIAIRHADPTSLRVLLADLRRRAGLIAVYNHPPAGPPPDWIAHRIAARRATVDRISAENPAGPPGLLLRVLGHFAQRAHARGLRDGDRRLSRAAALYRQAMALPRDRANTAADLFAQAATLAPEIAAYRAAQGRTLARAGDHDAALSAIDMALALAPSDHASLQTLVTSLGMLDRQPEALARTDALSVLLPDNVVVARAAAQAALAARRPRVALFHAQRALTINPADPVVHHLLARIHRRTGNTAMADRRTAMAIAIEDAKGRRTQPAS